MAVTAPCLARSQLQYLQVRTALCPSLQLLWTQVGHSRQMKLPYVMKYNFGRKIDSFSHPHVALKSSQVHEVGKARPGRPLTIGTAVDCEVHKTERSVSKVKTVMWIRSANSPCTTVVHVGQPFWAFNVAARPFDERELEPGLQRIAAKSVGRPRDRVN